MKLKFKEEWGSVLEDQVYDVVDDELAQALIANGTAELAEETPKKKAVK